MTKKVFILILTALCCLSAFAEYNVVYFCQSFCESCDPETSFRAELAELTGWDENDYSLTVYNTIKQSGAKVFNDFCIANHLDPASLQLPVAVVNGTVYSGTQSIWLDLPRDVTDAAGSDSAICFIYREGDAICDEVSAWLDTLPQTWPLKRGDYAFDSALTIEKLPIDSEKAAALLQARDLAEDALPVILAGDLSYSGAEAIYASLERAIGGNAAVGTSY